MRGSSGSSGLSRRIPKLAATRNSGSPCWATSWATEGKTQNPVNPVNPVQNNLRDSATPREIISQTAQTILDVRARYPDSSLADLYDPLTMPPDLRAAHAANDRAVLAAYGLKPDTPEPEIVAHLFKLYAEMTKEA